MEEWRSVDVDWLTYAETAIYRPVLMRAVSEGIVPDTVTFCKFPKPSLAMNYFSDPDKEIDFDFCRERGISVCRVISSGGSVLGDTGYFFVFLHLRRNNPKLPPNAEKMFEKTLTGIAEGLSATFNIHCRFRPLNDIETKCDDGIWRKIGPSSCFYEEKGIQMASGLQVKAPNLELISGAIRPAPEKFMDKETKSVRERITYLEKAAKKAIDLEEVRRVYIDSIERGFQVALIPGKLTEKENAYYNEMEREYTSEEFLMERSERKFGKVPADFVRKMIQFKVPQGPFVRIVTYVKEDRIKHLLISGNLYASPLRPTSPIHEIEKALEDQPIDMALFKKEIEGILNRPHFNLAGLSPELLSGKIHECATQQ